MKQIKLHCWTEVNGEEWERIISFPFPPFVGLIVGNAKVKEVAICQGSLDGKGEVVVEIEYKIQSDLSTILESLESHGWKRR